jgi:hypothetical protein
VGPVNIGRAAAAALGRDPPTRSVALHATEQSSAFDGLDNSPLPVSILDNIGPRLIRFAPEVPSTMLLQMAWRTK